MNDITEQDPSLSTEVTEMIEAERLLRDLEAQNADPIAVFAARLDWQAKRLVAGGDGSDEITPGEPGESAGSFVAGLTLEQVPKTTEDMAEESPRKEAPKKPAVKRSRRTSASRIPSPGITATPRTQSAMDASEVVATGWDRDFSADSYNLPMVGRLEGVRDYHEIISAVFSGEKSIESIPRPNTPEDRRKLRQALGAATDIPPKERSPGWDKTFFEIQKAYLG